MDFLVQGKNAVAILVISNLLMGVWNIVAAFFAGVKEFFTGIFFA